MHLSVGAVTALAQGRPVPEFPARWDHDYRNRIGVLPLDPANGEIRWFDIEPGYILHTLNSYETGSEIVLVAIRTPRMFDRDPSTLYESDSLPTLHRWTLDLATGRVREETVDDRPQDWPGVDSRKVGRHTRIGYSAECLDSAPLEFSSRLLKHDLANDTVEVHDFGPAAEAGEPMFVPGIADDEEDGWLLSLVYRADTDSSDLVILNAGDFSGEPQAVVHLPVRVPHGFHGCWSPDTAA
jgi:carotenoid cleavage dioxygenase